MSIKSAIIERLNQGAKNTLFLEDEELKKMLSSDNEFRRNYRKGVNFYIIGAWGSAKDYFKLCLKSKSDDGPCKMLLKYMAQFGFVKPAEWRGFRRLYNSK